MLAQTDRMDSRLPAALRSLYFALALTGALASFAVPAASAQDTARGGQLYGLCAACHGDQGAGDQARSAPALVGLPGWYITAQIEKFQKGLRAYHADDVAGLQMRPMARSLVSADDVANVIA